MVPIPTPAKLFIGLLLLAGVICLILWAVGVFSGPCLSNDGDWCKISDKTCFPLVAGERLLPAPVLAASSTTALEKAVVALGGVSEENTYYYVPVVKLGKTKDLFKEFYTAAKAQKLVMLGTFSTTLGTVPHHAFFLLGLGMPENGLLWDRIAVEEDINLWLTKEESKRLDIDWKKTCKATVGGSGTTGTASAGSGGWGFLDGTTGPN